MAGFIHHESFNVENNKNLIISYSYKVQEWVIRTPGKFEISKFSLLLRPGLGQNKDYVMHAVLLGLNVGINCQFFNLP